METILKIEGHAEKVGYSNMEGYAVTTDKQVIKLLIDNHQDCCESWGYFLSEDDIQSFIGATLFNVTLTDTALHTHQLEEHDANDLDAGGIMFVNVHTSKGTLQFVAYNSHNGYYGHEARVISQQLTHEETL